MCTHTRMHTHTHTPTTPLPLTSGFSRHAAAWVEDEEWTASMRHGWSHPAVAAVVDGAIRAFGADT